MKLFKHVSKATLREITTLAWPMALNAILLQSMTIIDLLFVASLGDVSVAAYGVAGAIVAFVLGVQFAIANGTQLVLSRAVGAGNVQKVGLEMVSGWVANMGFSILALLALLLSAQQLVDLITHNKGVAEQATSYVQVSLFLLFFSSISQVIVVYFNASKKSKIPLYGFLLEIPINVVCSAILVYGLFGAPALGLAGAAWGSVIAVTVRLLYLAIRFNQEKIHGSVSGFYCVNRASVKAHLDEVIPIVANFVVLLTGQMLFQTLFAQLRVPQYAAITLILPWIKIGSLFVNSWAQSSTIIVSQYIGKNELQLIAPFVLQSKLVATLMSLVMVAGFFVFSCYMPVFYPNLSTETMLALAVIAPIYCAIPIFRTNNMFCGNMVRAMGESYLIVRINIMTVWVISLPLCAALIYFNAPLYMVFGVILFDEIIKSYPFNKTLKKKLNKYMEAQ
jgi:putative MATE family efflux protein